MVHPLQKFTHRGEAKEEETPALPFLTLLCRMMKFPHSGGNMPIFIRNFFASLSGLSHNLTTLPRKNGVPQEILRSPVLFITAINVILSSAECLLTIVHCGTRLTMYDFMQDKFNWHLTLSTYGSQWGFKFNVPNCVSVVFPSKYNVPNLILRHNFFNILSDFRAYILIAG